MTSSSWVFVPLRIVLALLLVGLVAIETLSVPGQFRHMAAQAPELGAVPWVLMTLVILELVAVQVVIVCIWRLLDMVRADRIFSTASHAPVDVIVWTVAVAWAAFVGVSVYLVGVIFFTPALRDPGTPILLLGLDLLGGVPVLVLVVLRALLRQATVLRTDLEAVI